MDWSCLNLHIANMCQKDTEYGSRMKYRVHLIYFCVDYLHLKMFSICKYSNYSFIYETSCLHSSVLHMHVCVSIGRAVRRCFCIRSAPNAVFVVWPAQMLSSHTLNVGVLSAGLIFRYSPSTSLPTASHDPIQHCHDCDCVSLCMKQRLGAAHTDSKRAAQLMAGNCARPLQRSGLFPHRSAGFGNAAVSPGE